MTYGKVWWLILGIRPLHLTHSNRAFTLWTWPEVINLQCEPAASSGESGTVSLGRWEHRGELKSGQHYGNEWMMHVYSTLYCCTPKTLYNHMRWSLLNHHQCAASTWMATGQWCQCTHHTPATGGEERVIEPIKWMGIIRRPWLIWASGGNLARTPRVTPLLFTRSAMGFLMTTESQNLDLTSHPKDGWDI